ncbi:MAG TPA: hybrid-cluster NAD(P)-dependent oxidoreductase [Amycolatopsis sp.]|uniref:hybrid-cluster NAD(P)-dependent oxidoreductase n=1 Tax=Amycolatopsis sp. TaxID=37632 RepID=UPI002B48184A|nr:hybrid-cluster NAD(P)-dependent oxidoreductase [Amycolatopsis sp.]HKS47528.1 hybrid-cluster NAD(P)-dependent oxidoreductase [Amycolatopsis sp.]
MIDTLPAWAPRPIWDDQTDPVLVCRHIQPLTPDVSTFAFDCLQPRMFRHDPGQFVTLTLDIDGAAVERCYTISSAPTRPFQLAITVKRVPGGLVSNWLHDNLRPGRTVGVRGPLGRFSWAHHPAPKYLFLSGGSGITPLMTMTRTMYDLGYPADVEFVHCARTPGDIIFRGELELIAATSPRIRVTHVCEKDSATESWTGHRGRLTTDMLRQIAPDLLEREIFICGPAPYLSAVRTMVSDLGFDLDHFHQESFDFAAPTVSDIDDGRPAGSPEQDDGFTVEFTRSGRTIPCERGSTVLAAAMRAGVSLPVSCGEGLCGTCKTTLVSGSVDMRHKGGIRPREISQNKILLCCSWPRENLVVDA